MTTETTTAVQVDSMLLRDAIDSVLFACDDSKERPKPFAQTDRYATDGLWFESVGGCLRITATDGRHAASCDIACESPEWDAKAKGFALPRKAAMVIAKKLPKSGRRFTVSITPDDLRETIDGLQVYGLVRFQSAEFDLCELTIQKRFPDLRHILIQPQGDARTTVADFRTQIRRTVKLGDDWNAWTHFEAKDPGWLRVYADDGKGGELSATMRAQWKLPFTFQAHGLLILEWLEKLEPLAEVEIRIATGKMVAMQFENKRYATYADCAMEQRCCH